MIDLLLHAPQYRPNLSSMIRTAEFYGLKTVYIFDAHGLLDPPKNKKGRADMNHMARVWTAGAVDHIAIEKVPDVPEFLRKKKLEGRRILGTLVSEEADILAGFDFRESDLIIMGNERDGLPEEVISALDHGLYIPNRGVTDCLNVAVSCGIFLHAACRP